MNDNSIFIARLMQFYADKGRELPWRKVKRDGKIDPYYILVSEMMLQQTQVERVIPKYERFLRRFPTLEVLASSEFAPVLEEWLGLGYNRRARYLFEAAKSLQSNEFPQTIEGLVRLKGISYNTAAAILTYAYNQKHLFIETNIRTVIIHDFFEGAAAVTDREIESKMSELLENYGGSCREFYWALMDYGTYLKKQGIKAHRKSTIYKKQAAFKGSIRQLRGELLRRAQSKQEVRKVEKELADSRLEKIIQQLEKEGFIRRINGRIEIA